MLIGKPLKNHPNKLGTTQDRMVDFYGFYLLGAARLRMSYGHFLGANHLLNVYGEIGLFVHGGLYTIAYRTAILHE